MEKILERIEGIIEKFVSDLEKDPIRTSVKLLILYWIVKKVYREVKR
jgi:hypothetical protein